MNSLEGAAAAPLRQAMIVTEGPQTEHPVDRFRHEALLYSGSDEFVDACTAFVRAGVDRGEPTLVVALAEKLERLREALGREGESVLFGDMAEVGANPARIIPAWREFVASHASPGVRLRGIGEPIYPGRGRDALVECERHEALLNIAFADAGAFWLLCPYDTEALPPAVIEEARRNHPLVSSSDVSAVSDAYQGEASIAKPFEARLPEVPVRAAELRFGRGDLELVRRFVGNKAAAAGLDRVRMLELIVAVNEIASNSIKYGGGGGVLRIWCDPERLLCEVQDAGVLPDPLADRRTPTNDDPTGRGLWLANQLCDLVQVRSHPGELIVRMHVART